MNVTNEKEQKDKVEIHAQNEVKKGLKFEGSQRISPGHTLYSFNIRTGHLKKADVEDPKITYINGDKAPKKVIIEPDCIYFGALNKKNALKKLLKAKLLVKPEN